MIKYTKYRSRYASRVDPITRNRLDLGSCIVETIGYKAVYDHFILTDNITNEDSIVEIINTISKEYNAGIEVVNFTQTDTAAISQIKLYDKDEKLMFDLYTLNGISGLMYDISNKRFFVVNINELHQFYVKED